MKKQVITLAVAAALTSPAWAETGNVTLYGVANVSFDLANTGSDAAGSPGFSNNKVSSNTSRLGFKGSEELGTGLSAIWQIESLIQIDNSTAAGNGLATRNTFAGIKSDSAGALLLGRHDTPYNISTRKLDLFGDTIADNRSILGGGRTGIAKVAALGATGTATVGASFDGRPTDVLAYVAPNLSGFSGAVAYVAGAEGQTLVGQTKGSAWSAAGWYGSDTLYASLGYETHDWGTAAGAIGGAALTNLKESAWKLGLSYKLGALTTNLAYERIRDNYGLAGANALGHGAYYLGGKYAFGNDALKLAYSRAGANASANTEASQVSVGYDHGLSKRTTLYAQYTQLSNGAAGDYQLSANGTGVPALPVAASTGGAKPSAYSFGLKHTF